MTTRTICGIDPGVNGGIAFYGPGGSLFVRGMPALKVNGKSQIDVAAVVDILEEHECGHVVLEAVAARPGQGVSSMFNFGRTYGRLEGIIYTMRLPHTLVTPQAWKKALQVPADKDAARARASQLLPAHSSKWPLVKHDGLAESALLAYYGMHVLKTC